MSNEEKRPPGLQTTIHSGLKHGRDVTRLVRLLEWLHDYTQVFGNLSLSGIAGNAGMSIVPITIVGSGS